MYRVDASIQELDNIRRLVLNNMRASTADDALRRPGSEAVKLRGAVADLIHCHGGDAFLRPLNGDERDLALGFPRGASAVVGQPFEAPSSQWSRGLLTGNAWSPPAAAVFLQPLADHIKTGSRPDTVCYVAPFVSTRSTIELLTPTQRTLPNPSRRQNSPPPTEPQATLTH